MELLTAGRRWRQTTVAALLALTTSLGIAREVSEIDLKTVFLLRFGSFAEWPQEHPVGAAEPFVIGILGSDPFGGRLDRAVQGETIDGHPIHVQRFRHLSEVRDCSILFISSSEANQLPAILAALRGRPVLTVSDIEGFAQAGGMVQFYTQQNRVRLRVNLDAVRDTRLTISSKLLRAAEIVQEGVVQQ